VSLRGDGWVGECGCICFAFVDTVVEGVCGGLGMWLYLFAFAFDAFF
jgi:hypothetical protein